MYRQHVVRSVGLTVYPRTKFCSPIPSRKLTTPPSSSQGKSPAHPEGSNTLIILSALGALGGLYYYYTRGTPAADREAARRKEEEIEKKVREIGEEGRSKAEGVVKQGQRDIDQVKDAAIAVRGRATDTGTDLAERARRGAHDAQTKLDDFKSSTERKMSDIRDRSERKVEEGKEELTSHAREAEKKARGWFGFGSSK